MSLVFTGVVPHPPLLIPDIGKDNAEKVKKTRQALEEMEGDLYVLQPDTIFIISPHSPISPEAFSLNLATKFESKFEEFGDPKTKCEVKCDIELISQIKEGADYSDTDLPVNIITQPQLDHGICVPLYFLTQHIADVKIVPVSYSMLDKDMHLKFGKLLRNIALESNKRIAIIASGDLSHSLSKESQYGMTPQGKTFDDIIVKSIKENKLDDIVNINPEVIEKSHQCGYRSLLVLIGALQGSNYDTKFYSYEAPFGVGYLVAQFPFK